MCSFSLITRCQRQHRLARRGILKKNLKDTLSSHNSLVKFTTEELHWQSTGSLSQHPPNKTWTAPSPSSLPQRKLMSRHSVHSKALSLFFCCLFVKFGRHRLATVFIICWPSNLFKGLLNTINHTQSSTKIYVAGIEYLFWKVKYSQSHKIWSYQARPLAIFDFFFPFKRCALSFFLCLEFIHIGYCPCWSRRVFLFLLLSMSILQSSEKKKKKRHL